VIGSATVGGQFDQAVVSVTTYVTNATLAQGYQTIQHRVSMVTSSLESSGMSDVKENPSNFFFASPTESGNASMFEVGAEVSFTVTSPDPKLLINDSSRVVDAIHKAGLVSTSSTSLGAVEVSLGFSSQLSNQLTIQAYNDAVQNATAAAGKIANAQGLQIIGTSQVVQLTNQQPQQPFSVLSLIISLFGGGTSAGVPPQTISATVQVTFLVQKS
jgi:uncharacterized protein YggE